MDILKRIIAFAFPYFAEQDKKQRVALPVIRDFDTIFPKLMDDLIEHAKEYGVPPDTLNWYHKVLPHCILVYLKPHSSHLSPFYEYW